MAIFSIGRTLARQALPGLIDQRISRNVAHQWLKDQGIKVRRQDFLRDWAEIAGVKQQIETAKFIPKKFRPTPRVITATATSISARYDYIFRMKGFNSFTGEAINEVVSGLTDELGTIREIEDGVRRVMDASDSSYGMGVMGDFNLTFEGVLENREIGSKV